jgi:imidazolonepropionase
VGVSSILVTGIGELATHAERGLLTDAALVVEGERLAWVGPAADAPAADE